MVPYAKAIVWNNKDNRRNINMFLDMVKSVAVYSIRRREKFGDAFLANDDDFKMANKIYNQISATNTTNLSLVEMDIMRYLHEVTTANREDKDGKAYDEQGVFWVDAEDINSGGATVEQVAHHIKTSTGTARGLLIGRNGGKGLIHKVPGLAEIKKTVSRLNKESGIGKAKPKHIFVYKGGGMGLASYGDTAALDHNKVETAISEFKEMYTKDNLLIYNDLHKFYTGCKLTKRNGTAFNNYNNNLIHNKSNIIQERKKNTSDSLNGDVCFFSSGGIPESCEFVNLVNTGPADSNRKFTHDVNFGVPKPTPNTEKEVLTDNNNNNDASCHDANIKESVNDEPGENTLEMKRPSKKDKGEILAKMKVHFEGKTGEKLTAGNLIPFCEFVVKKHTNYDIADVMIDTKNNFNLEASA